MIAKGFCPWYDRQSCELVFSSPRFWLLHQGEAEVFTHRSAGPLLAFAAIASAAILSGCSGSPSQYNPAAAAQANAAALHSPTTPDLQQCRQEGGVRITPCRVKFDVANQGPLSISLHTPHGSKGKVVERDTCGGASGMASLSGSGKSWAATAGARRGRCRVRFTYSNNGKEVGWAVLRIHNRIK